MMRSSLAFVVLASVASAGCESGAREGLKVVATVGDVSLTDADLDVVAQRGSDRQTALASLIDSALLTEGAKREGLLDDPVVRARIDAARREVLSAALLERKASDATTETALRGRYDATKESLQRRRVHVAHIVIHAGDGAQAKMSTVLARLRAGDAFDEVARELSEDKPSAARGGELPPIDEGSTDAAFFEAAAKLDAGQTSDVVTTTFGMHVIRALSAPETVRPSFEEVRGKLAAEAMQHSRAALLKQLRETVKHDISISSRN